MADLCLVQCYSYWLINGMSTTTLMDRVITSSTIIARYPCPSGLKGSFENFFIETLESLKSLEKLSRVNNSECLLYKTSQSATTQPLYKWKRVLNGLLNWPRCPLLLVRNLHSSTHRISFSVELANLQAFIWTKSSLLLMPVRLLSFSSYLQKKKNYRCSSERSSQ